MITLISSVVILFGGFAYFQASKMQIATIPTQSEVWLDGSYLGDSPLTFNILDFREHTLELKFERSMAVVYKFTRFSIVRKLDVTSSPFNEKNYTADQVWKLETGYDGVFLTNRNDPEQRKPIIEYEVEEDPLNILAPPVRASISPNGKYAIIVSWLRNDTESIPAFWLVPVGEQEKRIEVFSEFKDEINDSSVTRMLDMGFSPDSKWIWITTNEIFAIASIDHPEEPSDVFDSLIFSWSVDGQYLAVSKYSEQPAVTKILQNDNGKWKIISDNIPGRTVGFSRDGRYLWTFAWHIALDGSQKSNYGPVRLIDLQTNQVISTIDTKENIRGISIPKESVQGNQFAFVYKEAFSQDHVKMMELSQDPNRGNLMIVGNDGIPIRTLTDENYDSVAYWLPDGKHLAAVVDGEFGNYIKIVNVQKKE